MGECNFNQKACVRALKRLGFYLCNKGRRANHDKYCPPAALKEELRERRARQVFIMVPRHAELHCQDEIVGELRAMGGDGLVEKFRKNL